ncbi:chitobiase/beta-hexosaminidase C-terminal domain-containing protein, partial [Patescibacteria group bacterium]|nr:chitobiase/beta-hexosaminidase C-terminal domain-containing protein [Patescibacteria group bacterium]
MSVTYLTWSSIYNTDRCDAAGKDLPECWNPSVFKQIEWANSVNQPIRIFELSRTSFSAKNKWPSESIPGATAAAKIKNIWSSSSVSSLTFTPSSFVTYTSSQNISISTSTSGAAIHYTLNNTDPTETSQIYSTPITISSTTTFKAKAFKTGLEPSNIATAKYTICIEP